jgi:hypothetical protein
MDHRNRAEGREEDGERRAVGGALTPAEEGLVDQRFLTGLALETRDVADDSEQRSRCSGGAIPSSGRAMQRDRDRPGEDDKDDRDRSQGTIVAQTSASGAASRNRGANLSPETFPR